MTSRALYPVSVDHLAAQNPICDFFRLLGHRITLSARASTFGGIVTPICLAVFKLITN
jgi:hypothetical protein